jgi:hypothetical protein
MSPYYIFIPSDTELKKPKLNCEMIWKIWKKGKLKCEMIWKIWKKGTSRIVKRFGRYRRKL